MNWQEFLKESARTDHQMFNMSMSSEFYHSIIGLTTESAELADESKDNNLTLAVPVFTFAQTEVFGVTEPNPPCNVPLSTTYNSALVIKFVGNVPNTLFANT